MGTLKDLLARTLQPGAMVGGDYQLQRRLGQGGFGEVWAAMDTRHRTAVALKMMPHQWMRVPEIQASLTQECLVLKTLAHPHICRVLDLVHDATYGPLLTTELIEGADSVAASRGAGFDVCWRILIQTLSAVSYLHGRGVLHLDIKPANVLVGAHGVKLIDFGLASVVAASSGAGTLAYMAPERIRGAPIDARADLYAVGVLFYEMLTGINPFQAPQSEEVRQRQLGHIPEPVSHIRSDLPSWVDAMAATLIAKEPSARYPSAKAVLNELQLFLGDRFVQHTIGQSITQAFAAAAGQLIGRQTILEPLRTAWERATEATPAMHWIQIAGARGMGKSRLLRECKFTAQLAGCQTVWCDAAADATPTILQPIAEALAGPKPPIVLCCDDYDRWGPDPDAHGLANLFQALATHPHPPTPIWCVATAKMPSVFDGMVNTSTYSIDPFTTEELTTYVRAVAPMPSTHLPEFVEQLRERTEGIPAQVAAFLQTLVMRGYFATASGQWDARLFADIVIDLPEGLQGDGADAPIRDADTLLVLCRHDRATGHAGRALAQLTAYLQRRSDGRHPPALPDHPMAVVVEAAECALTIGRADAALPLLLMALKHATAHRGLLLLWHGILLMAQREYTDARTVLTEGLACARAQRDPVLALKLQNQLARCALLQNRYAEAIANFRATRDAARALPPTDARHIVNNELGHALLLAGHAEEAIPILTAEMCQAAAAGAIRRQLRAQLWRAECRRLLGYSKEALADAEVVVNSAKQGQDLPLLAEAYNSMGMLLCQRGASDQGLAAYEQAMALAYSVHDLATVAIVTTNSGLERLRRGEVIMAQHALETTLAFLEQHATAAIIARAAVPARIGLAEIARQDHRYPAALQLLAEAESLAREHQILAQYQFPLVLTRAEITRDQGEIATARQLGRSAQPFVHSPTEQTTWREFMRSVE